MKIAQITTHMNSGGIPSYVMTLANALNQRGTESIIISSGGDLEPQLTQLKIPSFSFPIKTKFEFHPKLLFLLPKIVQKLREEKVDLIHAHTRVAQVLAALISHQTGIPFVSTCHGYYQPRLGRRIFPSWGAQIVAISDGVKNNLIDQHGISEKQVQTIYNGVDVDAIQERVAAVNVESVRKKWGFDSSDFVACTVARLVEEKGVSDFIDAALLLMPLYSNLKVLVVGEGREKEALIQKTKEAKLESRFVFTGRMDDVTDALAVSDVFVHPARWIEAFGLSLVEAMAAGLPVLMTRHWALFDVLDGQGCCSFVDKGNIEQIKKAIEFWVKNPSSAKAMGLSAKIAAKSFFDLPRMVMQMEHLYRQVLKSK